MVKSNGIVGKQKILNKTKAVNIRTKIARKPNKKIEKARKEKEKIKKIKICYKVKI